MTVEVVTQSMSNPVSTNGGQVVADAFMRIYGIYKEVWSVEYGVLKC